MTDDIYSEVLWSLPDDQMYTLQYREEGEKWVSTNEFNTKQRMKERMLSMPDHRHYRVVRISKYPPHGVFEVIYYRGATK